MSSLVKIKKIVVNITLSLVKADLKTPYTSLPLSQSHLFIFTEKMSGKIYLRPWKVQKTV